ncbi:MerR family transcriptional regulator [Paracoccus pacificus]|uniref:MerR family transcriptional regulator n=1 Tax=Paracoccus pacificus TaxID=1463598 RepID=A0ABW4R3R8_9RHOB
MAGTDQQSQGKAPGAFRSIGEVSEIIGVAPHVLRYWERQFPNLSPVKRGDGRRYYRPEDVTLIAGLFVAMRIEGMAIRGVKRQLKLDRGAGLRIKGAAHLGLDADAAEAPPAAAPAPDRAGTTTAAAPPPAPPPPARSPPAAAAVTDTAAEPGDSASPKASVAARRARSRTRPAPAAPPSLPLFPELAAQAAEPDTGVPPEPRPATAPVETAWIIRLGDLSDALRHWPPTRPVPDQARALHDRLVTIAG